MSDRSWDRLSGILIGVAIGFVAGVLMAPDKGEETRHMLKRRTQDSIGQLRDGAEGVRQSLTDRSKSMFQRAGVTEIEIDDANLVDTSHSESSEA
jgi:gas vesicle protein